MPVEFKFVMWKIPYSAILICIVVINNYFIKIIDSTDDGDEAPSSSHSRFGKEKLLELFPSSESNTTAKRDRSVNKGKRPMVHSDSPNEAGTSGGHHSNIETGASGKKKSKWNREKNDDLLYIYYGVKHGITDKWGKIRDIWYKRHGELLTKDQLRTHLHDTINMILYDTKRVKEKRIYDNPEADLLRIYYQTKDGGESNHHERIYQDWKLVRHPRSWNVNPLDLKNHIENKIRKQARIPSETETQARFFDFESNLSFNWNDEHDQFLREQWKKLSTQSSPKIQTLCDRAKERFLELHSLKPMQIYCHTRHIIYKNPREQLKKHKSKDSTIDSNHSNLGKPMEIDHSRKFLDGSSNQSVHLWDHHHSRYNEAETSSGQRGSPSNNLDLDLKLNSLYPESPRDSLNH